MADRPMRLVDGALLPFSDDDLAQWLLDQQAPPGVALAPLTARQLRLGLLGLGITPAMVDAQIATIPDETAREAARIEWEYSNAYDRAHPLIALLGAALGLTDEQIDAAWIAAGAL